MAGGLAKFPKIINHSGPYSRLAILREHDVRIIFGSGVVYSSHDKHATIGCVVIDPELMRGHRTNLCISVCILGGKLIKGTGKRQEVPFGGHFATEPKSALFDLLPVHIVSQRKPPSAVLGIHDQDGTFLYLNYFRRDFKLVTDVIRHLGILLGHEVHIPVDFVILLPVRCGCKHSESPALIGKTIEEALGIAVLANRRKSCEDRIRSGAASIILGIYESQVGLYICAADSPDPSRILSGFERNEYGFSAFDGSLLQLSPAPVAFLVNLKGYFGRDG